MILFKSNNDQICSIEDVYERFPHQIKIESFFAAKNKEFMDYHNYSIFKMVLLDYYLDFEAQT